MPECKFVVKYFLIKIYWFFVFVTALLTTFLKAFQRNNKWFNNPLISGKLMPIKITPHRVELFSGELRPLVSRSVSPSEYENAGIGFSVVNFNVDLFELIVWFWNFFFFFLCIFNYGGSKIINTYLLLTEFEVRTISYRSSLFFPINGETRYLTVWIE